MTLEQKIGQAVKLLQVFGTGKVVEVCFSGGKDSEVILELAKMAGIEYRAIYKNTTIDPPQTIAHCKAKGCEIMHPKDTFFNLIKTNGFPSRRTRFCCNVLKEYKVLDNAVQGIRRSESTARAKRYQEPIICRMYGSKKNHVNVCLPILEWSNQDVEQFIKLRGINCHPLYYDANKQFHVERRLGCIGCPLQRDRGKADFRAKPKFFRRMVQCGEIWWDNHPDNKSHKIFNSLYECVYYNIFCRSYSDLVKKRQPDLFGGQFDAKSYLEEYFGIKL